MLTDPADLIAASLVGVPSDVQTGLLVVAMATYVRAFRAAFPDTPEEELQANLEGMLRTVVDRLNQLDAAPMPRQQ